jgi:hypothetical protein
MVARVVAVAQVGRQGEERVLLLRNSKLGGARRRRSGIGGLVVSSAIVRVVVSAVEASVAGSDSRVRQWATASRERRSRAVADGRRAMVACSGGRRGACN